MTVVVATECHRLFQQWLQLGTWCSSTKTAFTKSAFSL